MTIYLWYQDIGLVRPLSNCQTPVQLSALGPTPDTKQTQGDPDLCYRNLHLPFIRIAPPAIWALFLLTFTFHCSPFFSAFCRFWTPFLLPFLLPLLAAVWQRFERFVTISGDNHGGGEMKNDE